MKNDGNMDKRILRFKCCDSEFYPYLWKVLKRLPEEIREDILNNKSLQIFSYNDFHEKYGFYDQFADLTRDIVYLNEIILKMPEIDLIHTIAHELAHYVDGGGRTGLYEKEAEELLEKWGFNKEVEAVQYSKSIAESAGYKAGYEWAKKQGEENLNPFQEYYEEWDMGCLSSERWENLIYEADPDSILDEMGMLVEPEELSEHELNKNKVLDIMSFDKGIVWGIMCYLKEQKIKKESHSYQREIDKVKLANALERIDNEFSKLFSLRGYRKYIKEARHLEIPKLYLRINDLLQNVKEDCVNESK